MHFSWKLELPEVIEFNLKVAWIKIEIASFQVWLDYYIESCATTLVACEQNKAPQAQLEQEYMTDHHASYLC